MRVGSVPAVDAMMKLMGSGLQQEEKVMNKWISGSL